MPISVVWRESGARRRRLEEIKDDVDPRSRKMDRLRTELKQAAVRDNAEKLLGMGGALAGVDRFGRPLAPLGAWAQGAAFRRRGNGPVLAPHGLESRIITHFRVVWQFVGGSYQMVAGWRDLPWMRYHLTGGIHLPRRDVGGTSPGGWVEYRSIFARFAKNLLRKGA